MINNTIQNNNHSILDILRSIERLYNEKGECDSQDVQELIDLICLLLDGMNESFRYRIFKLTIGRPNRIWNLSFTNSMRC